jgi:uncharacterized membrane protein
MAMRPSTRSLLRRALWSGFFLLIVAYAAFAVSASGAEILHRLGLAEDVKRRSAPIFFIVHAFAGTTALVAGPLQRITTGRSRTRCLHRVIGRAYVVGVVVAATTALRMAITFDVPAAGRVSFAVLAILWTGATVLGVRRILVGDVPTPARKRGALHVESAPFPALGGESARPAYLVRRSHRREESGFPQARVHPNPKRRCSLDVRSSGT